MKKARVIVLLGNGVQHRNTLATLINRKIKIVGVFIIENKKFGVPLSYIFKSFKRRGFIRTISQILARIVYLLVNKKLDDKLKNEIFNDFENIKIIKKAKINTFHTINYKNSLDSMKKLKPDLLIAHTGAWVGKRVREIESVKYVIGGHPGITPFYRGSHSPFWAIYNNDLKKIGWTSFILDSGVDTGPIIEQGVLKPNASETYMSLSWRGMVKIASSQADTIELFEKTGKVTSKTYKEIPQNSEYYLPTLKEQIIYWIKQNSVR